MTKAAQNKNAIIACFFVLISSCVYRIQDSGIGQKHDELCGVWLAKTKSPGNLLVITKKNTDETGYNILFVQNTNPEMCVEQRVFDAIGKIYSIPEKDGLYLAVVRVTGDEKSGWEMYLISIAKENQDIAKIRPINKNDIGEMQTLKINEDDEYQFIPDTTESIINAISKKNQSELSEKSMKYTYICLKKWDDTRKKDENNKGVSLENENMMKKTPDTHKSPTIPTLPSDQPSQPTATPSPATPAPTPSPKAP